MRAAPALAAALLCAAPEAATARTPAPPHSTPAQTNAASVAADARTVPDPPLRDDDIVVEGRRMPRAEASRAAADLLRRQVYTPEAGVYARYRSPVCVRVAGLTPEPAERVAAVVRSIAADVAAPVASGACEPNLVIAFALDGRELAQRVVRARRTALLLDTRPHESRPFLQDELAVRWIYRLGFGAADGAGAGAAALTAPGAAGLPHAGLAGGQFVMTGGGGIPIMFESVTLSIDYTLVIVDAGRAAGHPFESVAAYAARVALAQTRMPPPSTPQTATTILTLFANGPQEEARGLTDWDRSLLRGLYRTIPNLSAWRARGRIHGGMVRTLAEGREVPAAPQPRLSGS